MSDDASQFDPRFDPAFQRGFNGPTSAVPREKLQPTAALAAPVVASVVDAPQAPAVTSSAPAVTPQVEAEPEPRRANPFLISLFVVALLLIGGGLYLVSKLGDMFANPSSSSQYDYITLQALTIGAPLVIVLGIATGIGVLFVYAVRFRR